MLALRRSPVARLARHVRLYSKTNVSEKQDWYPSITSRIGKCFFHGASPAEIASAAGLLQRINKNWIGLVAGAEGYLVEQTRRRKVTADDLEEQRLVLERKFGKPSESDNFEVDIKYLEYAIDSRYNFLDHIRKSVREQELMKEVNDFFDQDDVKQPDRISARHPLGKGDYFYPLHRIDHVGNYSVRLTCLMLHSRARAPAVTLPETILNVEYSPEEDEGSNWEPAYDLAEGEEYPYRSWGRPTKMKASLKEICEGVMQRQEESRLRWLKEREEIEEGVRKIEECFKREEVK